MNKENRVKKIQEIIDRDDPFGKQEIPWEDGLPIMPSYRVPLDYLIYNKHNGRILSRTKSLERQNHNIDVETDSGKELIGQLLWNSNTTRNKKTLKDLEELGQQKVGIITKDGIIIDGNRRAMLLGKLEKYEYFKAVILPVTLDENPMEVQKLETKFQMGEDEKIGYNATEKYLKSKEIYLQLSNASEIKVDEFEEGAIRKISDWMGEPKGEIEKYLNTMIVMDEYLNRFDYDGIYTQLDGREDQFLSLTKWLNIFYNTESKKGFDGYKDHHVDDLKWIAFDYIRLRGKSNYDGREFRNLAEGNKENHFFGDKTIWDGFTKKHFSIIKDLPKESEIDIDSKNLQKHLDSRDSDFFENSKSENPESLFIENLNEHKSLVGYNKASDKPEKLIKKSLQSFEAIKTKHPSFSNPKVQALVKDLGDKVFRTLNKKSPSQILAHVIELLGSIDESTIPDTEIDKVKEQTKEIQSLGYAINKLL